MLWSLYRRKRKKTNKETEYEKETEEWNASENADGSRILLVLTVIPPQTARAASGTVYTCSVTPSYSNPVTGEIEDAGGEAGYATGQGMVQSVVYSTGILEVTDSGEYYLTVRLDDGLCKRSQLLGSECG